MKKYVIIFDQIKKSGNYGRILDFTPTEEEKEFLDLTNWTLSFFHNSRTQTREWFAKDLLNRVLKLHKIKDIQIDRIFEIRPMNSHDII